MQIMISTGTEHANQIESIVTDTESQVFLEQNIFFLPIIPKGVSAWRYNVIRVFNSNEFLI